MVKSMGSRKPAPFVVGESPFRTKGLVYVGAHDYYEHAVPGGLKAVYARIEDDAVRAFAEQRFLPGGWYDALPIAPLSEAAARVAGVTHGALVRANAAWLARRDLQGVYRIMVQLAPADLVARRLSRLSMQYFDFGTAETKMTRANAMETLRHGIPEGLAHWFIWAVEGFVPVALEMAGAKKVAVRWGPPSPDGALHGSPTVRIRFEIAWQ